LQQINLLILITIYNRQICSINFKCLFTSIFRTLMKSLESFFLKAMPKEGDISFKNLFEFLQNLYLHCIIEYLHKHGRRQPCLYFILYCKHNRLSKFSLSFIHLKYLKYSIIRAPLLKTLKQIISKTKKLN
jgi:hypothetical protein